MKRSLRFLLLASAPALFLSVIPACAKQSAQPESAASAQAQSSNQASSHDRHHRRHSNVKRHRHHHKPSA